MKTVISLFAGCGGSSLGYELAGYKELLAIDWDDNAIATFKLNFKSPIEKLDITKTTGKYIKDKCNIVKGQLDILDGSPPCQGFSTAGKRKVLDPRNDLVRHYIRLVGEIRPHAFIMENVSGMVKGTMRGLFVEYTKMMKQLGYNVKCKLMNAAYYNVPQSRQRLIWIGIRNDLNKVPEFPIPNKKTISVQEAIGDLQINDKELFSLTDKYGKLWPRIRPGGSAQDILGYGRDGCHKLDPKYPSFTLQRQQGTHGYATTVHYKEMRRVSILEAQILQSFPKDFKFIGKYEQQWARIGNSVPPLFMKAIAETVGKTLDGKRVVPPKTPSDQKDSDRPSAARVKNAIKKMGKAKPRIDLPSRENTW